MEGPYPHRLAGLKNEWQGISYFQRLITTYCLLVYLSCCFLSLLVSIVGIIGGLPSVECMGYDPSRTRPVGGQGVAPENTAIDSTETYITPYVFVGILIFGGGCILLLIVGYIATPKVESGSFSDSRSTLSNWFSNAAVPPPPEPVVPERPSTTHLDVESQANVVIATSVTHTNDGKSKNTFFPFVPFLSLYNILFVIF